MIFSGKNKLPVWLGYTPKEINEAWKMMIFPQMGDRGIIEMKEKNYKDGNFVRNYKYLYDPNHFKQ